MNVGKHSWRDEERNGGELDDDREREKCGSDNKQGWDWEGNEYRHTFLKDTQQSHSTDRQTTLKGRHLGHTHTLMVLQYPHQMQFWHTATSHFILIESAPTVKIHHSRKHHFHQSRLSVSPTVFPSLLPKACFSFFFCPVCLLSRWTSTH